jgi:DNA-binding CsgD family transcriptional regulator
LAAQLRYDHPEQQIQVSEPGAMSVSTSPVSDASTSRAWTESLARAIDCVDDPRCPGYLIGAIAALVDFDMAMSVVHNRRAKPVLIHDTFKNGRDRRGLSNYLDSTYVLNPVYAAHCNGLKQGVYRIGELAPDAYLNSEHYRTFKVKRLVSEEIGYVTDSWPAGMEELVLAIELQDDRLGEISLSRAASRGGFSDSAIAALRGQIAVIGAVFRQIWQHSLPGVQIPGPTTSIDDMLDRFGEGCLSPREREVAQLILKGHSGSSIGARLGISQTTVKSHRQNLYGKLGIASQFELFSQFLQSLSPADS